MPLSVGLGCCPPCWDEPWGSVFGEDIDFKRNWLTVGAVTRANALCCRRRQDSDRETRGEVERRHCRERLSAPAGRRPTALGTGMIAGRNRRSIGPVNQAVLVRTSPKGTGAGLLMESQMSKNPLLIGSHACRAKISVQANCLRFAIQKTVSVVIYKHGKFRFQLALKHGNCTSLVTPVSSPHSAHNRFPRFK